MQMVFDFVDKPKLIEILDQVILDEIENKAMLLTAGKMIGLGVLGETDYDKMMDEAQKAIDILGIEYNIEHENVQEGNGNDLYTYSQETLDEMCAGDNEREQVTDKWAYDN